MSQPAKFDLTKHCALCGGELELAPNTHTYDSGNQDDFGNYCSCESRTLKGHCGECRSCKVAMYGCACDGAYDAGCFNCTPKEFERPSCPVENFNRCSSTSSQPSQAFAT